MIFQDDFNRADAAVVENDWITNGPAALKGNKLHFQLDDGEFRPRARRTFAKLEGGSFYVSFRFDWLRKNEGSWAFFMQLGNGAKMPKSLIYERDLAKGVGVNLAWGGRDLVGGEAPGSFGYFKDMKFHQLFMANDSRATDTVVSDPVVTLEIDLDVGTYTVRFNGKTYPNLPPREQGADRYHPVRGHRMQQDGFPQEFDRRPDHRWRQKPAVAKAIGETDAPPTSDPEEVEKKPTGPRMVISGELAGVDVKTFKEQVAPLMEKHCVGCHGPDKQKARLRFDGVRGFRLSDRHLWTMVHEQLTHGDMPPEDELQPSKSGKAKMLAWIEKEQRALGAGSTRRLNRREFGSALQDLTGLTVDFAYSIPGDGKVNGFDTGASSAGRR